MPSGEISLQNHKHPYEKLQNAFRINLRTGMLITPDGQFTIPLDKLDLTETYTDKEKGVVFQTDKEWRPIPLEILGSLGTHFKSIQKLRSEAEKQAGIMEKNMQGLLLAAQRTNDPSKIADAFELLETARAAWTTNKAEIVKEIQRVPANAERTHTHEGEAAKFWFKSKRCT